MPPKPLPTRIRLLIAQARAILVWERFAPAYLMAGLALLIFAAGAWAGVWERIGDPWRGLALLGALAVLGLSLWRSRGLRLPTRSRAKRRLETDNDLPHRPLDTIEDSPVLTDRGWAAHQSHAEKATDNLSRARLRPVLAGTDRPFLRYLVPVVAIAAIVMGWGDNGERLRRALSPSWQSGIDSQSATFEAWIDPPAYTGRRPVTLKADTLDDIPEGSTFVARISGVRDVPRLLLETGSRDRRLTATRLGPESFEVRTVLEADATARIRLGQRRQVWNLGVVADTPPSVEFSEPPEADKRDRLALTFDLTDDYGVEKLALELTPLTDAGEPEIAPEEVDVALRGAPVAEAEGRSQPMDLTRHRWAGRKVRGVLVAADGKGQIARSEPAFFTIPDKIFIEPLAKAVVENRALILAGMSLNEGAYTGDAERTRGALFDTWEPGLRLRRAPEPIQRAAVLIDAITEYPEDGFDDPAVFMGLRNAASRMRYADEAADLAGLDEDLWKIAIRAEFGRLGTALEDMRRAQQALNNAIARRAPQREVDTLFDRYNEAVDRYVETLREDAEQSESVAEGGEGGGRNVDEIQELMDAIEEANRIGDTEGARLALAKLAELLENMKIQMAQGGGGGGSGQPQSGGEMSEEMRDSLEELADLLGEQRDLRDDTEQAESGEGEGGEQASQEDGQQAGEGQDGGDERGQEQSGGNNGAGALAERQDELGAGLGTLRDMLPEEEAMGLGGEGEEAQAALDGAEEAMERAEQALIAGDLGGAQSEQDEAIRQLRQAGRGLAEALASRRDDGEAGESDNPLGQDNQGGSNDPNARADIQERDNAERSREILDELRRRAAEQERSREERNYLERLMKRF